MLKSLEPRPLEHQTISRKKIIDDGIFAREMTGGGLFTGHMSNVRYEKVPRSEGFIGTPKAGIEVVLTPTRAVASTVDRAAAHIMDRIIRTVFRPL